ncbi:uncharacterized protein LOC135474841 [Liolophura sinensis]|uniref:uncharacterized protein LOC135474841 n=1 Tax=Liolophura sinensis TaxID=3198878 RepID=UPI003158E1EA
MFACVKLLCCLVLLINTGVQMSLAETDNKMQGIPRKDDPLNPYSIADGDLSTRIGNLDRQAFKRQNNPSTESCRQEFQEFPNHTMCLPDHPWVKNTGVSGKDRGIIVDMHNQIRANVQPPAGNMQKMVWDNRLAEVAQKWAQVCQDNHDEVRNLPGVRASVGQNVFDSNRNVGWETVLGTWAQEVNNFKYGQDPEKYLPDIGPSKYKMIGHYTQLVKAESSRIGCGYAKCPNLHHRHRYVCNYAPGQNAKDLREPYEADKRCSQCGAFCNGGLCDCGGLVCENHSKMNASVCACNCHRTFSGRDCAKVNCHLGDNLLVCPSAEPSFCSYYTNVPQECPHMCGLCSANPRVTVSPTDDSTAEEITATSPRPSPPEPIPTSELHVSSGLDKQDRKMLLRKHNRHRDGEPLVWDNTLEEQAQLWANQCKPRKDPNLTPQGHFDIVYQLRGLGYRSWADTFDTWKSLPDFLEVVGPNVTSIGCGFAECEHKRKRFYFCNYGGNEPEAGGRKNHGSNSTTPVNTTRPGNESVGAGSNITVNDDSGCGSPELEVCQSFTPADCDQWRDLPSICPHLCDRCRESKTTKCTGEDNAVCSLLSDKDCLRKKLEYIQLCPRRCGLCHGKSS